MMISFFSSTLLGAARVLLASALLVLVGAPGCESKDCVELCEEGQAGDCTSVNGDCGAFCNALDNVQDASGCSDAREAYGDCLNEASDVCDSGCGAEEVALGQCVGAYCVGHSGEPDCQTLQAAF